MNRVFKNNNGHTYTIILGGIHGSALLVKHSNPDNFDFVVTDYLFEDSWSNARYHYNFLEALEDYRKRSRQQEL